MITVMKKKKIANQNTRNDHNIVEKILVEKHFSRIIRIIIFAACLKRFFLGCMYRHLRIL